MRRVERADIVDYVTYEERRDELRREALAEKASRRIHVGGDLTFLFETTLTVRYQIQEMMRAEQIVREADVQHEIDTYNELLGGDRELGATLLIGIDDPVERAEKLARWLTLPEHLYVRLEDGSKVRPVHDPRQVSSDRVSSVQYLRFAVEGQVPVAVGADHPALTAETELSSDQRAALARDLRS